MNALPLVKAIQPSSSVSRHDYWTFARVLDSPKPARARTFRRPVHAGVVIPIAAMAWPRRSESLASPPRCAPQRLTAGRKYRGRRANAGRIGCWLRAFCQTRMRVVIVFMFADQADT